MQNLKKCYLNWQVNNNCRSLGAFNKKTCFILRLPRISQNYTNIVFFQIYTDWANRHLSKGSLSKSIRDISNDFRDYRLVSQLINVIGELISFKLEIFQIASINSIAGKFQLLNNEWPVKTSRRVAKEQ